MLISSYKVGKVDQVKDPEKKQTKAKAVDRALDRIFTPATATDETFIFRYEFQLVNSKAIILYTFLA